MTTTEELETFRRVQQCSLMCRSICRYCAKALWSQDVLERARAKKLWPYDIDELDGEHLT